MVLGSWTGLDPESDYEDEWDDTLGIAQKLATMLKIANTPKTLLMDTLNSDPSEAPANKKAESLQ